MSCQDSHLDPELLRRIAEQKKQGGIEIDKQATGTRIEAQTKNTLYKITVLANGRVMVEGGRYFPEPKETRISGSTWGSSILKFNWLGVGMHIEFSECTTTAVKSLKIIAPDASWEYSLSSVEDCTSA